MVRGNHGLAGGAREFPTRPVSQFVEEEKEGRKPRWNELEGKLSAGGGRGGGALSHVGKKLLSVTFFASFCTRSKGNSVVVASSEFEISRALGLAQSQRWSSSSSAKILHHFCKVNSDASSPLPRFRQTRKATRFPPTFGRFSVTFMKFHFSVCVSAREEKISFLLFPRPTF